MPGPGPGPGAWWGAIGHGLEYVGDNLWNDWIVTGGMADGDGDI